MFNNKKCRFTHFWPLIGLMLCLPCLVNAQRFGNEWINYNQTYYKISIAEDGIYRINHQDLLAAGFPVNSVDPRRMQLFFRGQEQSIFIQGQQDARFDATDFIVFYGQRNDGTQDRDLYVPNQAQTNPYHNLYSDSTAYFLTWSLSAVNGKRMINFSENNISGIPAEPYHWEEKLSIFADEYSQGRQYPLGSLSGVIAHLSTFDYGEGWTGTRIARGQSRDFALEVPAQYASGPAPQLEILLAGRNNRQHDVTIQVGNSTASLRTLSTVNFDFYDHTLLTENLQWSDLAGGNLVVRVTVNGVDGVADQVSVSYLRLRYPQQTTAQNLASKKLNLPANPSAKSYVQITNAPPSPYLLDVTDGNNVQRIGFNQVGINTTAIIPNTQVARRLLIGSTKAVPAVKRMNFQNISTAANYLMVSHERLRQPAGNYSDPVRAYQEYRASAEGGGFNTLLVNIDQLYNQFSYGEVTPLAIRRLADFMLTNGNPEYLLLIGKGLTVNYNYHRQNPATATLHDLVPTGGIPGSDVVLTSGLAGSDGYNSAIPTGRINAQSAQDVAAYLNKVKESEGRGLTADYQENNTREALWKKHLVHLSGGLSLAELTLFGRYVDDFQTVAESDFLGGQVSVQSKRSNNATELINIADEVNKGLSLITFFGHSATTRSDIEIGYVSNDEQGYRNKGKYPAILINGCNAGNVFADAQTFGEDWIKTPDRGALHVIAHSAEGISSVLKRFSDAFYSTAFGDSAFVGSSMGKIKDETSRRFMERLGGSAWEVHIAQVRQAILQGDPAVSLLGREKPDFEVNDNSVFITPLQEGPITVFSDSFAVNLVVRNFGRTSRDSLTVSVNRTLNNGTVVRYGPVAYPSVLYQDTLQFVINSEESTVAATDEVGNNRFEIIIDSNDTIAELNENNNRAYFDYFVPLGGTVHLSPPDYAIVSQEQIRLQLQAGDLQKSLRDSDTRQYLIEIDTSYGFDSPVKQQFSVNAKGLAIQEAALAVNEDSTVYYWRSKYAEQREGEIDQWTQSSFTFLKDHPTGWSQMRFEQLNENQLTNLEIDSLSRRWEFPDTEVEVEVLTSGATYNSSVTEQIYVNGTPLILADAGFACKENSLNVVVFDRYTLNTYVPINPGGFDIQNPNTCGRRPQMVNTYTNAQIVNGILEPMINAIEEGNPLVIFNIGTLNYASWPATTLAKLEEVGIDAATISALQSGEPLIISSRKGAELGTATIQLADPASEIPATEQLISLNQKITGKLSSGGMLSRRIGPASHWNSLSLNIKNIEASDVVSVSVIGETANGGQVTLLSNIALTGLVDLTSINAAQYPYLRLEIQVEDVINRSPAQLDDWIMIYQGVAEGILLSDNNFSETLTKQEGESFSIPFRFYNLSQENFADSLQVAYSLFNQNSRRLLNDTLKLEAVQAGDTASFQIPVNTMNNVGISDLTVNVNPRIQPEQSYNNNALIVPSFMKVNGDELNPIIDVAFDGTYILDGDIVSPTPMITIEVRDENPYLQKQDTTGLDIFLGKQETAEASVGASHARTANAQMKRIALSSEEVSWTPAEEGKPFKISFQPAQLEDGLYTLSVQAEDASGNASGTEPYQVNFEIINESTITNFYPYPNPFSTSTRFVFTLTGQEIPDQIKVQIMTVSGKVVREITQDELGLIRIGNNITDYAWDGKDEFGDQLANGVYLYRVMVQSNGQALEMRETAGDRGFKNGFGKMYILR